MKDSSTNSKRGGYFKGNNGPTPADSQEKWGHTGFEEIIREQKEKEQVKAAEAEGEMTGAQT